MNWVPVYDDLFIGAKANLSCAARCVFIRLCQLARPRVGAVEWPQVEVKSAVHAIMVLVGVTFSDAKRALHELTSGLNPMVVTEEKRYFRIPSYARWAFPIRGRGPAPSSGGPSDDVPSSDDSPDDSHKNAMSSAERVRRYRERHRNGNGGVTGGNGNGNGNGNGGVTGGNGNGNGVTALKIEENTIEDQSVCEESVTVTVTPLPAVTSPVTSGVPPRTPPAHTPRVSDFEPESRPGEGTRIPADWEPDPEVIQSYRAKGLDATASSRRFRDHYLSAAGASGVSADWQAKFRRWVQEDAEKGKLGTYRAPRKPEPEREPEAVADPAVAMAALQAMMDGVGAGPNGSKVSRPNHGASRSAVAAIREADAMHPLGAVLSEAAR